MTGSHLQLHAENKRLSFVLVLLRVAIGWHFLYEGVVKIVAPEWTCQGFLQNSQWLLSDFFHWVAANPRALHVVNLLNAWGLALIGVGLILGCLTRLASLAGILILALYYVALPPFLASGQGLAVEGRYLFINNNVIEMLALAVLVIFPAGRYFGLDRILYHIWITRFMPSRSKAEPEVVPASVTSETAEATTKPVGPRRPRSAAGAPLPRREALKSLATFPILGAFGYAAARKHQKDLADGTTGATIQVNQASLKDLKGQLPMGTIKGKKISRVILGGNLIGGWSHSRDLIYVSSLFKAYNNEKKVFETLMLAEKAGVNTINITHTQFPIINKYKRETGSKLQTVCQIHPDKENLYTHADKVIDNGVDFIQIQGNCTDWRVRDGEIDVLEKCITYIREQGYPAGLGAHSIQAMMECDKAGLEPDFYMKTLHHDQYWSAHPKENRIPYSVDGPRSPDHNKFHDNMFCLFPDQTIAFMKRKNIPFMAFKVLAGGAIHPSSAFEYAFQNGADFLCVGMFDFQIVEDVNIAMDTLAKVTNRERPWCA